MGTYSSQQLSADHFHECCLNRHSNREADKHSANHRHHSTTPDSQPHAHTHTQTHSQPTTRANTDTHRLTGSSLSRQRRAFPLCPQGCSNLTSFLPSHTNNAPTYTTAASARATKTHCHRHCFERTTVRENQRISMRIDLGLEFL